MKRIDKLKQSLISKKLSSFLIFNDINITYLTGFNGHAATLLLTPDTSYFITDYRYFEQAINQVTGIKVICRDRQKQSLASLINQLLLKNQITSLAFEADHVSFNTWQNFETELNLKETIPLSRMIEKLRYFKDANEIDNIAKAATIADKALNNLLPLIKQGVTEKDLSSELEYQMSKLGSEELSFATILLFGERSALPHGIPGNQKLKNGEFILLDFGAVVNGYRSDMTRTYILGKPSVKQKEIYDLVQTAQQAAITAISDGVSGQYLAEQSDKILNASPYGKYKGEGLGHGVGLELHELPFMNKTCGLNVEKGCVITIEPGIYIPGWGGVRIEDDLVLTDDGLVFLTNSPRELLVL
jgi:Xaa-Pro aminopeptidase/Xaa-Pro dipeptidase